MYSRTLHPPAELCWGGAVGLQLVEAVAAQGHVLGVSIAAARPNVQSLGRSVCQQGAVPIPCHLNAAHSGNQSNSVGRGLGPYWPKALEKFVSGCPAAINLCQSCIIHKQGPACCLHWVLLQVLLKHACTCTCICACICICICMWLLLPGRLVSSDRGVLRESGPRRQGAVDTALPTQVSLEVCCCGTVDGHNIIPQRSLQEKIIHLQPAAAAAATAGSAAASAGSGAAASASKATHKAHSRHFLGSCH